MSDSIDQNPPPRHWGLLGTTIWGIVIATIFTATQIVFLIFAMAVRSMGRRFSGPELVEQFRSAAADGTLLSISTFLTCMFVCGAVILAIKLKRGSVLKDYLCLHPVPFKTLLPWVIATLLLLAATDATSVLRGKPISPKVVTDFYSSTHPVWMLWIALVVAAPLQEEVFFRGFLFKGMQSSILGPVATVLITTILWASLHSYYRDTVILLSIGLSGLLLGAARVKTKSLLTPLLLHALTNLIATIEAMILSG